MTRMEHYQYTNWKSWSMSPFSSIIYLSMTQKCDFPLQSVKIPEGISCGDGERERERDYANSSIMLIFAEPFLAMATGYLHWMLIDVRL